MMATSEFLKEYKITVPRCGSAAARLMGMWIRIPFGYTGLSDVSVVCCQEEVSATGRSLLHRSPTECVVAECDLETSTIWRPRPTMAAGP
jgi:hypothetical protein